MSVGVTWTLYRLQTAAPKLAQAVRRLQPQLSPDAPLSPDVIEAAQARLPRGAAERPFAQRLVERLRLPGGGCAPTLAAIIAGQNAAVSTQPVGIALDWSKDGIAAASPIGGDEAIVSCVALADGSVWTSDKVGRASWWDSAGTMLASFEPEWAHGGKLAVLADGRLATSANEALAIWHVADGKASLKASCTGHTGKVLAIAPCADGGFASMGEDNTLRTWDARGLAAGTVELPKSAKAMTVSADIIVVALSDFSLQIHSRRNPKTCNRIEGAAKRQIDHITCLEDGRIVFASADGFVKAFSRSGKEQGQVQASTTTIAELIPLRGNQFATVASEAVRIWSADLELLGTVRRTDNSLRTVAALADGRLLSFGFVARTTRVWRPT